MEQGAPAGKEQGDRGETNQAKAGDGQSHDRAAVEGDQQCVGLAAILGRARGPDIGERGRLHAAVAREER